MNKKKNILILIDWYLPGRKAGGPVKSIESFVSYLKDEFNFFILTTDTDLGETVPYPGIEREKWTVGPDDCRIYYLEKKSINEEKILSVIKSTQHDFLYLNSFFSRWFSIIPLKLKKQGRISSRIILAPRGMLSEGALRLKSMKKRAFIFYSKLTGLHRDITWHATYDQEVKEIKNVFGDESLVRVCPNFSKALPVLSAGRRKIIGELNLFYLSRVARVKNLHIALKALAGMNAEGFIRFDIYGAGEDQMYIEECRRLIQDLPSNIRVKFKGEIPNEKIPVLIKDFHFLFLPTSNENFGHSILESLQCGCPVIISDKTPWRNLEEQNCGWDVKPESKLYATILKKCLQMSEDEYATMSAASVEFAKTQLNDSGQKEMALQLFS